MTRTLAELDIARREIEQLITGALRSVFPISDLDRAAREDRLAQLHVNLALVFAQQETAAMGGECLPLACTLRWAVIGAEGMARGHREAAQRWRDEHAASVIAGKGQP